MKVNKTKLDKIFGVSKPVIGMLHLGEMLGSSGFLGVEKILQNAKKDISSLEKGGIDGILIENWKEKSLSEFVSTETAVCFSIICYELSKFINVPFGINVLNNDYKVAYSVAKLAGASFIQLDVFVDEVVSDFKYNKDAQKAPFTIKPSSKNIFKFTEKINASNIPLLVFVQPKHYLLKSKKSIELSTKQAIKNNVSGVIVTKETTVAPTIEVIKKVKKVAKNTPVGIGSGFSKENALEILEVADFAIVGSALKIGGITDNPVDIKRVKKLMGIVKKFRKLD